MHDREAAVQVEMKIDPLPPNLKSVNGNIKADTRGEIDATFTEEYIS
jgi:hypothetical protein